MSEQGESQNPVVRVCFVCLGNICRSPTADGVMRAIVEEAGLSDRIFIDSAGTSAVHVGEAADRRSAAAAKRRGYDLTSRSRQFEEEDWDAFDFVLAMDGSNLRSLQRMAGAATYKGTLALFRDFDSSAPPNSDTPDPYYGGRRGFDTVLDIIESGCAELLDHIRAKYGL